MTLSAYRRRDRMAWAYALITLVFAVTTVANMVERPDGLKIAGCFIAAIVINVIANEPNERDERNIRPNGRRSGRSTGSSKTSPRCSSRCRVADASEFEADLEIRGEERFGYQVLTVSSAAVPNSIAASCLAMRDEFGLIPHGYFDWTEGSPLIHFLHFILWGSGEVAPVTREILRRAEPGRPRRPHVHAG